MKWIVISIICFAATISMGQNESSSHFDSKNEWAVSITGYPFYKWFDHKNFLLFTMNTEFIHQRNSFVKTSYSLIAGAEWSADDMSIEEGIFGVEISKVYGKKIWFFEWGIGFSTSFYETFVTHPKIGGRIHIGNQFLIKGYYVFYIRSNSHSILNYTDKFASVSLGYRFGLGRKK